MALTTGMKLGPYEIQSPLGAGGMGEVYRARDMRLDRTVAVKVLPSHLSSNTELRARFEREARAISGLQHPNICVLYDVGSQEGIDFLVMEYLEGETLHTRLARKPLASDDILKIATEVAEALEKAHRSGIVHRDLKPGNVMLTKTGAKLMDFGLAKPYGFGGSPKSAVPPSFSSMDTLASMASPVTMAGTLIGTVQYMSPEQIQGKEADARSDIFAFGAMLYEMLTGRRAFEGKSQLSVASAILEREAEPISVLQPTASPAVEHVVRTCLAKDPEDRFQSAHDLKVQLQWIATAGNQAGTPAVVNFTQGRRLAFAAAMVAGWLVAAAAGAGVFFYANRAATAQQLVQADIDQPDGYTLNTVQAGTPALSPDGQRLVFVAARGGQSTNETRGSVLLLRQMTTGKIVSVAGTENGSFPFWSPDGKYVGFFADGKLKKVEAGGGAAQALCDAPEGRGGSWSPQGTIIFAPRTEGALVAVSEGGGTPWELRAARKEEGGFTNRNPLFLPDGKHFLFVARAGKVPVGGVYVGSLDGSEPKEILHAGSNVAYSDGYLFYLKDGTLTAQGFDARSLRFTGNPVSIAANIEYYNPRDLGFFSASRNALVYRIVVPQNGQAAWLDADGKDLDHWGEPVPYEGGTYSASAHMAVLYRSNPAGRGNSLWLADAQRKTVVRLTEDSELDQSGAVASDGNSVFISSSSGYMSTLVRRWLTASGKEDKLLTDSRAYLSVMSISRDGRYVFFNQQDVKTSFDIHYLDLKGDQKVTPLLTGPYGEADCRLSPDNKWLAYTSDETGRYELYVTSFPDVGSKWQVSSGGIVSHNLQQVFDWSPDGKNLRYQQGDKVYSIDVHDKGDKLEFSAPKEMATLTGEPGVISILPDGERTLVIRPTGEHSRAAMDFVLNWQHLVR